MKPQRSTKYRMHRMSKFEYPAAEHADRIQKTLESRLGRPLKDGTKTAHSASQWCWKEPR